MDIEGHATSLFMARFDESYDMANLVVQRFMDIGIDIYGTFVLASKTASDINCSKQAVVKVEIIDTQVCVNGHPSEDVMHFDLARSQTCKLDVMEINNSEDILQVDSPKVGIERVRSVLGNLAVYMEVTSELRDLEAMDIDDIVMQ